MHLAVFDLDHTLLAADSDYLWGQFLCDQGLVDREHYETRNRQFYADYAAGELDVDAFYQFSLAPLMLKSLAEWEPLRQRFVAEQIRPRVARQAPELLARHRDRGDLLLITTATQRFITEPIAELLGVEHLLASEPEIADGRFTGRLRRANFQAAKVSGLQTWLAERAIAPKSITAYSDSRNDIPLLELADTAVAVDPDPTLREHAERQGWPVISLR
jgi:HAD superfamily hydrolase (TIGR01490 family)